MNTSGPRRPLMLAISIVAMLIVPWVVAQGPQASAQVDTTTTTEPTTTTTTLPPTTTTTRPPTTTTRPRTTTTRPRTTTTRPPTTTTTTTLPPTTTTVTTTTTTTTTTVPSTTTTPAPRTTTTRDPADPDRGGFVPVDEPTDPTEGSRLPGWSLPFLGAGAMLGAIVIATGLARFFTRGVPAIGRGFGSAAYRVSNGWALLRERDESPTSLAVPKPTIGARIGGFFLALTSPFRRLGRGISSLASAARRQRESRQAAAGGVWDRLLLRFRMTRARWTRTRSSVEGQRRYWWLRFRRFIPWLR